MLCPACQKSNPEDARFCMHCGCRLLLEEQNSTPASKLTPTNAQEAVIQSRQVNVTTDASGNVIITGDDNQVTLAPDKAPALLLRLYYRAIADECSRLPLGLLKEEFTRPGVGDRVSLKNVYTDLDVVNTPRSDEGKDFRAFGLRLERGEKGDRAALLDAISQAKARYIVLVGGPGSGKTTFVNYLAACLASGATQALPDRLRNLLPARLELRRAALHVPTHASQGEAGMLWDALGAEIARQIGAPAAQALLPYMQRRLENEGGLILLDGLDEAPEAGRRRRCLLEAIRAWTLRLPRCRFLLTARPYAYADPQWQLPNFDILALAPFNQPGGELCPALVPGGARCDAVERGGGRAARR